MKSIRKKLFGNIFPVVVGIVLLIGCNEKDNVEPNESASINMSSGDYLVDGNNRSLYIFTLDVDGLNNCSGNCIDLWPVFYEENVSLGPGLNAEDFGEITLNDGSKQITYLG